MRWLQTAMLALVLASCSDDERMPIGVPPDAERYCQTLGYILTDAGCTFPDGTSCNAYQFFNGVCGPSHTYCELHGGVISTESADMGTFTSLYAVCTTASGAQCREIDDLDSHGCP
ncbi:MAG: hypothetical protein ABI321_16680 [Polyangia bacterium]